MSTYAFEESTGRLLDATSDDCGWPHNPELHWKCFYETRKRARCEEGHELIAKQRGRLDGAATRFWSHLSGQDDHTGGHDELHGHRCHWGLRAASV